MPTLEFKGKPFVYSHHLSVPFRELRIDADKSLPAAAGTNLDDNLIIHGDNLEALKALLPRYAGKVDVVYIDPPYNTGNEAWAYNDNVNAPALTEWLGKVVDAEDMERHDKWLSMMWPRLQLLKELLSSTGAIFISIDDREQGSLRSICDEIFGEQNFIANLIWQKKYSPANDAKWFSDDHDFIICYAKSRNEWHPSKLERSAKQRKLYKNPDNDERGDWKTGDYTSNKTRWERPNGWYPIVRPKDNKEVWPNEDAVWRFVEEEHLENVEAGKIWWGKSNLNAVPAVKRFLTDVDDLVPRTIQLYEDAGHTQDAAREIKAIFGRKAFQTPKPSSLISRLIHMGGKKDALVLDSFAGSGTTAQAVLALNAVDGGNRRFILVETEDYADTLTAERVRRVIKGVPGAKDEALANGLGGSFTYCDLGGVMDLERFFAGDEAAPAWDRVAEYVAYTATGATLKVGEEGPDGYAGEAGGVRLHLIYRPDQAWMRSNEAMLDLVTAERIKEAAAGQPVLVFAAGKFMAQKALTSTGLTFCQLPYSIHRILGDGNEGVAGVDAA